MTKTSQSRSNRKTQESKTADSKKKRQLKLVGLLLIGLVIALLTQPGGSPGTPDKNDELEISLAVKPVNLTLEQSENGASVSRFVTVESLPSIAPSTWANINLFQRQGSPKPKEPASPSNPVAAKKQYVVGAVYGGFESNEGSALVDGEVVRRGEKLDGGLRVLSVGEGGISVIQ